MSDHKPTVALLTDADRRSVAPRTTQTSPASTAGHRPYSSFANEQEYYQFQENADRNAARAKAAARAVPTSPPRASGPAPLAEQFQQGIAVATIGHKAPPAVSAAAGRAKVPSIDELRAKLNSLRNR
jgi:hypothetical protein